MDLVAQEFIGVPGTNRKPRPVSFHWAPKYHSLDSRERTIHKGQRPKAMAEKKAADKKAADKKTGSSNDVLAAIANARVRNQRLQKDITTRVDALRESVDAFQRSLQEQNDLFANCLQGIRPENVGDGIYCIYLVVLGRGSCSSG